MKPQTRTDNLLHRNRLWYYVSHRLWWTVLLPVAIVVVTLVCGTLGFQEYYRLNAEGPNEATCSSLEAFWLATGLPLGETTHVVVLDRDRDNPFLEQVTGPGVVCLTQDATSVAALQKASIRRAESVYVTTSSDEESCRIVRQIARMVGSHSPPPCIGDWKAAQCARCRSTGRRRQTRACYVHVQSARVRAYLEDLARGCRMNLRCFSTLENTARRLLTRHPVVPRRLGSRDSQSPADAA